MSACNQRTRIQPLLCLPVTYVSTMSTCLCRTLPSCSSSGQLDNSHVGNTIMTFVYMLPSRLFTPQLESHHEPDKHHKPQNPLH